MSFKEAYEKGQRAYFAKLAGGPGSGVSGSNTTVIGLPKSEYVSVGSRKALLDNMHYRKRTIPLSSIKAVAQEKCVPSKLQKFFDHPDWITNDPIDVLEVEDGVYHMIDGHHRYLAALGLGIKEIPARVRKKAKVTKK